MYAATAWVWSTVSSGCLRGFSAPGSFAGIRPVLTWKSTAAAPTPIRLGAMFGMPCASKAVAARAVMREQVLAVGDLPLVGDSGPGRCEAGLPDPVIAA